MAIATDVLNGLARLIDQVMPGCRRQAPQTIAYNGGFAVSAPDGGQLLVSAGNDDPWFLTVTAGLAHSIGSVDGALSWVNEKNSNFSFGRFYASIPAEGDPHANVVFQEQIFSRLIDMDLNDVGAPVVHRRVQLAIYPVQRAYVASLDQPRHRVSIGLAPATDQTYQRGLTWLLKQGERHQSRHRK